MIARVRNGSNRMPSRWLSCALSDARNRRSCRARLRCRGLLNGHRVAVDSISAMRVPLIRSRFWSRRRSETRGSRQPASHGVLQLGERIKMTADRRGNHLMWALACRIEYRYDEINDHTRVLTALFDQVTAMAARQLPSRSSLHPSRRSHLRARRRRPDGLSHEVFSRDVTVELNGIGHGASDAAGLHSIPTPTTSPTRSERCMLAVHRSIRSLHERCSNHDARVRPHRSSPIVSAKCCSSFVRVSPTSRSPAGSASPRER